jgi:hypothetical protein
MTSPRDSAVHSRSPVATHPRLASLGLTDHSQVVSLGFRCKHVKFGAEKDPVFTKLVSPNRLR